MLTKFTIIVPTRERADSLKYCLHNLLRQQYQNFEILVSDNNSHDSTSQIVSSFGDERIRYVNTESRVSMTHNWEFALTHVNEGWILFIGDDDGLLPYALSTLDEVIRETGCEALTTASCTYWWPLHFASIPDGSLSIPFPIKQPYEIKNSAFMLNRVMCGRSSYSELPWLYNGGASSLELVRSLRARSGKYFHSRNPDVYSAISLALGTQTYVSVNIPIAINGASKFSSGTSYMLGQKNDPSSATSLMLGESNLLFHPTLESGKSSQILVYESYLQAIHLYDQPLYELSEQIKIALIIAPNSDYQDILSDCRVIAEKNCIAMPGEIKIRIFRATYRFYGMCRAITRRRTIKLSARGLGVWDVSNAGDVANYIYQMFDCLTKQSLFIRLLSFTYIYLISIGRYCERISRRYRRSN